MSPFSLILTTGLSLSAFAFNSILCRKALGGEHIDASGFTSIRMVSGAVTLLLILGVTGKLKNAGARGNWLSSGMLFFYALGFSYAYLTLDTGTGALILFAAVQITMIMYALFKGDSLGPLEWAGLIMAFSGFLYLVLPGLSTPSLSGFVLMTLAGICWGGYTLRGKGSQNPLAETAFNFLKTLPFVGLLMLFTFQQISLDLKGVLLAILSGALASGVGYSLWYTALKGLTTVQAAALQLLVPILAAVGGLFISFEPITLRLIISATLILGGIFIIIKFKHRVKVVK